MEVFLFGNVTYLWGTIESSGNREIDMKRFVLLQLFFSFTLGHILSQTIFQKSYGNGHEGCAAMERTSDGGYIFTGGANAFCIGLNDVYLFKTDSLGNLQWTKTFKVNDYNYGFALTQNIEGGYAIAAATSVSSTQASFYFIKTDNNGNLLKSKTYGNYPVAYPNVIQQTSDSGYVVYGFYFENNYYSLLVRTDKDGEILWSKTYYNQVGKSLAKTNDNGFILCGFTPNGVIDIIVTKIDSLGNTLWTQIIGIDSAVAVCNQIKNTKDGGYIIVGYNQIGNVSDVLLMKIDSLGNVQWVKTYGGTESDSGDNVDVTADGGYVVIGGTYYSGDIHGDAYLLKTDSAGNLLWSKSYGAAGKDWGFSVKETPDGGYAFAGGTWITSSPYLFKTDSYGGVDCFENNQTTIVGTPATHNYTASFIIGQCNVSQTPNTVVGSVGVEDNICNYTAIPYIDDVCQTFDVYPNPALQNLIIETQAKGTIEILSIEGRTIKTMNCSDTKLSIDVSNYAAGVYLVKINSGNGVSVKKFIKQ